MKEDKRLDNGVRQIWTTSLGLLNQWGGLHSLSGMRKKSRIIIYKKESYTSIMENGLKIESSVAETGISIEFLSPRGAKLT